VRGGVYLLADSWAASGDESRMTSEVPARIAIAEPMNRILIEVSFRHRV
jgi:hypothetical protein